MRKHLILAAAAAVILPVAAACAPPSSTGALIQRTACSTTAPPTQGDACTRWINRKPAWGYPADTEWIGPLTDYAWDKDHNGAELVP